MLATVPIDACIEARKMPRLFSTGLISLSRGKNPGGNARVVVVRKASFHSYV
ncbi:MAG: hypothetical protein ACTSRA_01075 [Promethearchaeota archaeon]